MPQLDLTSYENLKPYMQLKTDDEAELLNNLIIAASAAIRDHCDRYFSIAPEVATREVEVRDYENRCYLDEVFGADDVVSVTDLAGAPIIYEARYVGRRPKGTWLHFGDPNLSRASYPADHADWFIHEYRDSAPRYSLPGVIRVTATWGWTAIPPEVEFACQQTVKYWYETQVAHFGRQVDLTQGTAITPEHLPSAVTHALREWVHPQKLVAVG